MAQWRINCMLYEYSEYLPNLKNQSATHEITYSSRTCTVLVVPVTVQVEVWDYGTCSLAEYSTTVMPNPPSHCVLGVQVRKELGIENLHQKRRHSFRTIHVVELSHLYL